MPTLRSELEAESENFAMSIRLCQECCQWFWCHEDRCPVCLDSWQDEPDPNAVADRVRPRIGEVRGRIGAVSIRQRKLPSEGLLYETAYGLFFLPHRNVTVTRLVEEGNSSPLWNLASIVWAPLMFVLPFIKAKKLTEKDIQENQPVKLQGDNLQRLPDLLGRMPGSLFIAARDISRIRTKSKRWQFDRVTGCSVVVRPISDEAFTHRMHEILDSDQWHVIMK